MKKGNVLLIGNSGVGKSTLINAVLGEKKAQTGWGTDGTTKEMHPYENDEVPFRLVDTAGFEPSFFKELKSIVEIQKWSREAAKDGDDNREINLIWFCIEGTSSKLFPQTIKNMLKATDLWKSVPIVVVITKSYSVPEREQNIELVKSAFEKNKVKSDRLKEIIPIVAETYQLNDTAFAAPEGVSELIEITNSLMPEGIKASKKDISTYQLNRKRALAQSMVGVMTASAVAVGAVPIPFADGLILAPLEMAEISGLAKIYNVKKDDNSKRLFEIILDAGTVSVFAKMAISSLKGVPGVNIPAIPLNPIIAGSIVAGLGEASIAVFEKIYVGDKSIIDTEWVSEFMENQFSESFVKKATDVLKKASNNVKSKDLAKDTIDLITSTFVKKD